MYPEIKVGKPESQRKTHQDNEEKALANHSSSDTLLHILIDRTKGKTGDQHIIIFINIGSQCSYITKGLVVKGSYQSSNKVTHKQRALKYTGIQIKYDSIPIELLAGACVVGNLMTGERIILEDALVALNTYLGWRLM
ncbi:hypothetical protein PR048_018102 [Dryococelus australis]|uniref:Uncharacterized protein n=1 Tax=Dryococelus australis TaxID=614101 RepID=A0ABQ9HBP7_9NEOP|nr:hypothetical protein PR048_018102 [Dryococelus australis]